MLPKYRKRRSSLLKIIVKNWPLRRYLGVYAFMPLFFIIGAAIEYSMINWTVGQTNFYGVYKLKRARELAQQQIVCIYFLFISIQLLFILLSLLSFG